VTAPYLKRACGKAMNVVLKAKQDSEPGIKSEYNLKMMRILQYTGKGEQAIPG
jgi:hypothetical protein